MASYDNFYNDLATTLHPDGFILRGGFHMEDNGQSKTIILIGNAGSDMWDIFSQVATPHDHALDIWTGEAIDKARDHIQSTYPDLALKNCYPFEGPPYHPFQHWAQKSEGLTPSPIYLLIHPVYGLWHAYRGAMICNAIIPLPEPNKQPSPCESCTTQACLKTCPVNAFPSPDDDSSYDVMGCAKWVAGSNDNACMSFGCQARLACPVGIEYRYSPDHSAFHMRAFLKDKV